MWSVGSYANLSATPSVHTVVILFVTIFATSAIVAYKVYFARINEKTREAEEACRLHCATIEALAGAIDAKDQMTHLHLRRVQHYCVELGKLLKLDAAEIKALQTGALLHDIGKLAVPDYILNKPGELTAAEFERMKVHTRVGAQILERIDFPYPVIPLVLYHHERWDGCGYPEGLRASEIPLTARILAVADSFDTVREERPYRRALSGAQAAALLRAGAGTHFDARVVKLFLDNLARFEAEIAQLEIDFYGYTPIDTDLRDIIADSTTPNESSFSMEIAADAQADDATINQTNIDEAASVIADAGITAHLPGASNVIGGKRTVSSRQVALVRKSPPAYARVPSYLNQIRDAHREAHLLYDIARTFGSSLDVQNIAASIISNTGNIVSFDACALYLFDEEKQLATLAHAAGRYAETITGRTVEPGQGLTGYALANRCAVKATPERYHAMLDWAHLDVNESDNRQFASALCLPLVRDARLLGALALYSFAPDAYTNDHLRVLETVTDLASDALGNAIRHAEIESNSLTDSLTGLPNARALDVRFEEEAARARRTHSSFQLMMLDLDDFKKVNDTFGHKTGDLLLSEIAKVLSSQMREYDFLARYAGDEFVAIIQELDFVQMAELERRIERAVVGYRLPVREGLSAQVGISIGSARFPSNGSTLDALVVAADAAMYNQKSNRKIAPTKRAPLVETTDVSSSAIN